MLRTKKGIYDKYNPDRGLCSIDGCNNLQHNHGKKRWGKLCCKHHKEPFARAERVALRTKHKDMVKAEIAARNIEYRRSIAILKIYPRPCTVCGKDRERAEYRTPRSTTCLICKANQHRNSHNKCIYGLDDRQYNLMLLSQNGVCAICGEPPVDGIRLCIDHCHNTNIVRGLLCSRCNVGIGQFDDDLDLLASAASYLINSRVKEVAC